MRTANLIQVAPLTTVGPMTGTGWLAGRLARGPLKWKRSNTPDTGGACTSFLTNSIDNNFNALFHTLFLPSYSSYIPG